MRVLVINDKRVSKLNLAEAAWLAAAIDADGWIYANTTVEIGKRWPVLNVAVCNTNRQFVDWAAKLMMGYVAITRKDKGHLGWKTLYRAEIKGHTHVLNILKQIEPYLIIKKENANKIVTFIEGRAWGRRSPESCQRISRIVRDSWQNPEIRRRRMEGIHRWRKPHGPCKKCGRTNGAFDTRTLCHNCYRKLRRARRSAS